MRAWGYFLTARSHTDANGLDEEGNVDTFIRAHAQIEGSSSVIAIRHYAYSSIIELELP